MTIQQIYDLAIEMGIRADLRGRVRVKKDLERVKEKYQKMSSEKKKEFDTEKLTNPYSDSRILIDKPRKEVKRVLAGIDIGPAEVLLANQLGDIDLIISHHPMGKALADLGDVMRMQAEVLSQYGIPINIAEGVLKERIGEVSRGVASVNHNRVVDTAKLLGFGLICTHTPCDNLAANFLEKKIRKDKPETVGQVIKSLKEIPEYIEATKINAGPKIFVGSEDNRAGKIVLTEVTGGTEGSKDIYEKLAQAGIGTVIGMHIQEEHRKEAEKYHINVVIAGHISSDSIGMNLFLDKLEARGVEVIPCSGLIRIKRKAK